MNPFFAIPDRRNIQDFTIYSVLAQPKKNAVTKSWTGTRDKGQGTSGLGEVGTRGRGEAVTWGCGDVGKQ